MANTTDNATTFRIVAGAAVLFLLLAAALGAARAAAQDIMGFYGGEFEVEIKADQTPVTVADKRAEDIILDIESRIFSLTNRLFQPDGKPIQEVEATFTGQIPIARTSPVQYLRWRSGTW